MRPRRGRIPVALATLVAAFAAAPASAEVKTVGNGIYAIAVQGPGSTAGLYAAGTAAGHPLGGGFALLYGTSLPRTTFNTVHSYTTGTDYVQGEPGQASPPSVISLSPTSTVEPLGSTGLRTTRTLLSPDKLTVVTDTIVHGSTPANSIVEVTTRVTNNNASAVKIGIRYLWDVQVGLDDGPMFQPLGGAGFFTNEAAFAAPSFASWRVQDNGRNFSPPLYDVLGSAAGPVEIGPAPTPPTLLEFGCFESAKTQAFAYAPDETYDVSTSQSLCGGFGLNGDSGVLLYWGDQSANGTTLAQGQTKTVTAVLAAAAAGGAFSDTAAPTSTISAPGCTPTGEISFRVTDVAGGTGARAIHTRVDGGFEQVTETAGDAAVVTLPEGAHTIEYWGEDRSGNQEPAHHSAKVVVDATRPTIAIASDQGTTRYLRGAVATVTTTAADAGSGLGTDPSGARERIPTDRTGEQTLSRTARDVCGNLQTTTFTYTVLAVAAREFFVLDSTRECSGNRRLRIRLRQPLGEKVAFLRVRINGRVVRTFSGAAVRPTLRLSKVTKSRMKLVLEARTQSGSSLSFTRTYAKCPKKKKAKKPKRTLRFSP